MNTILGGSGFIGHYLAQVLEDPFLPERAQLYSIDDRNLGHVYYCLGDDTGSVEPNLAYLCWLLRNCSFDSLVYLSSTRVYLNANSGHEGATLTIDPYDPGYQYNVVKLAAEAACMAANRCKVARLSTVVGLNDGGYLIPGLIKDALKTGVMHVYLQSQVLRDIIAIEDVVDLLPKLHTGKHKIYNVASGVRTTVGQIVLSIEAATNSRAIWHTTERISFPTISISRIIDEFGFVPTSTISLIPGLCRQYGDVYVKQVLA